MNTKHNSQAITDYLLGALSAAEAERFDELSFTDESFNDKLSVTEKDLIDAYINDELSGEKLERFESHYLASPLRREKVEFARSLQIFAEKELAGAQDKKLSIVEAKTVKKSGGFFSTLNFFSNPNFAVRFGFAVVLLLFTGIVGWFLVDNMTQQTGDDLVTKSPTPQEEPTDETDPTVEPTREIVSTNDEDEPSPVPTPKTIPTQKSVKKPTPAAKPTKRQLEPSRTPPRVRLASFVLTPPLRGTNKIKTISIPVNTSSVAARLELELDEFSAYRISLIDQSNDKNLWQSGAVKSAKRGENGSLNVRFPAKLLRNRIYTFRVSGVGENGSTDVLANYPFRVVIK